MSETLAPQKPPEEQNLPDNQQPSSTLPAELSQFSALDAQVASDGSRRIYGVDAETGKKTQVKGDDVLDAYGYSQQDRQDYAAKYVSDSVSSNGSEPAKEPKPIPIKEVEASKSTNSEKTGLRPVKKGEALEKPPAFNSSGEDLPVAAMGGEPWTLDIENGENPPSDPPQPPGGPGNKGTPEGNTTPIDQGGVEPPVEGGPKNPVENDPRKRIGEAVNKRIEELKQNGMSESDAHAQAHDEFWGNNNEDEGGGERGSRVPERITSPELEAAEAKVDEARTELARLRAGREGATFFSIKYSKKKLEAAFEAYEEAKAEAGSIAVDLLRERGVEGKDLVSAIHYGAMEEFCKITGEQFGIEKEAVEGKRFKRFYSWWKDQGTKLFSLGTIKKAGAMAAITLPIGIGASIVAAPLLGGAGLAAGVGVAFAKSASRGMIGNRVRKNADAREMTDTKAEQRTAAFKEIIDTLEADNEEAARRLGSNEQFKQYGQQVETTTGSEQRESTTAQKKENDKDARRTALIALGTAGLAYGAAELAAHYWPFGGGPKPPGHPGGPGGPKPPSDFELNESLYKGITMEPGAAQRFSDLIDHAEAANIGPDNAIANSFRSVASSLNDSQKDALGTVLGRLSNTPHYGNAYSLQHMDELARLAAQDQSAADILSGLFT